MCGTYLRGVNANLSPSSSRPGMRINNAPAPVRGVDLRVTGGGMQLRLGRRPV